MIDQITISLFEATLSLGVAILILIQLIQLKKGLISSTQTSLYNQSSGVRRLVADYPEIFPYIYDGKSAENDIESAKYARIKVASFMQLSYLENLITQESNIDKKNRNEWLDKFITMSLTNSPEMTKTFEQNKKVYSKKLRMYYDEFLLKENNT